METIKCTKCKLDKNVSEFYKSKTHKLGYVPTCKNCESLRHNKKYDPEKRKKLKNIIIIINCSIQNIHGRVKEF